MKSFIVNLIFKKINILLNLSNINAFRLIIESKFIQIYA